MVKKIIKKTLKHIRGILFADPNILLEEEKHLINQPFYFKGNNGKGVILIHGWTSTPYEVRRLGKYLNEEGFTVSGPLLRGHGTRPEDLEDVLWQDWLGDLSQEFDRLKQECKQVYVGGTSVGGNLAILLAKEKPEVAGLVLMATPYRVKFEKLLRNFFKFWGIFNKYSKKYYPPTFGVTTTITRLISYQRYPIINTIRNQMLFEESRLALSRIMQPCFIIKSRHDHIIARNSVERIYAAIGSKIKKKRYIDRAYHTFISDIKNEFIFEEIAEFLKEN